MSIAIVQFASVCREIEAGSLAKVMIMKVDFGLFESHSIAA